MSKLNKLLSFIISIVILFIPFNCLALSFSDDTFPDYSLPDTSSMYLQGKQLQFNQFLFYDTSTERYIYIAVEDKLNDSSYPRQFLYKPADNLFCFCINITGGTSRRYTSRYAYYYYDTTWHTEHTFTDDAPTSSANISSLNLVLLAYDMKTPQYDSVTHNEYFITGYGKSSSWYTNNLYDVTTDIKGRNNTKIRLSKSLKVFLSK